MLDKKSDVSCVKGYTRREKVTEGVFDKLEKER